LFWQQIDVADIALDRINPGMTRDQKLGVLECVCHMGGREQERLLHELEEDPCADVLQSPVVRIRCEQGDQSILWVDCMDAQNISSLRDGARPSRRDPKPTFTN